MTKKIKALPGPEKELASEMPFDIGPRHGPEDVQLGQWYWVTDKNEWSNELDDEGHKMRKGQTYKWDLYT